MKFAFSNKEFYKRHNKELERYLIGEDSLHIVNAKSKSKVTELFSNKLYLDLNQDYLKDIEEVGEKYSLLVLTDIIENSKDLYALFKRLENILLPNGKLVISSINTKWSLAIKFFEYINFKDSNKLLSYIHINKIQNIANGLGLEFVKSSSRQFVPFKIFGLGNLVNKILESLFYYFNFGIKTYIVFRKKAMKIKH